MSALKEKIDYTNLSKSWSHFVTLKASEKSDYDTFIQSAMVVTSSRSQ